MSSLIVEVPWTAHGPDLSKPPEGISQEDWGQWSADYGVCSDVSSGLLKPGDMVKIQINYVPSKITEAVKKIADEKAKFKFVRELSDEETPKVIPVKEIIEK